MYPVKAACFERGEKLPMNGSGSLGVALRKESRPCRATAGTAWPHRRGLIGPNGAGKTTTMECIEGIRKPDRGTIAVLGLDPFRQVYKVQERIGVQLQQAQLQKRIKVLARRPEVDEAEDAFPKTA
jgi:ATPase subunit of ABC transporter with duplicated ATPase domains